MKSFESLLTVDRCRETLLRFWTEQTDVDQAGEGLAIALPLLYPDGWQVQVFVEPISPAHVWGKVS
ncbi:protein of unknown function [Methylacidimicrobium sp. AP8]|uniref:hypothetical protein n=1 Tax=Methylacidimicrobium sp. AP8 TaxID=2730359 RepID=UPI0018C0A447|nr:hypothetical protein [Methylacidimicrobium sp. AP8]CAB4243947.1 protein of unknown function [Methylacidimicrobium sp. AP8]